MKKYTLIVLHTIFCSSIIAENTTQERFIDAVGPIRNPITIMSYNIRRKGNDPEEYQWKNRKELIFKEVLSKKPAIIGFQEVVSGQQFEDLKKGLPGYKSFGDSRNDHATLLTLPWLISKHWKAQNECNPIFYDPEQVTLMEKGYTSRGEENLSGTFGLNPSFFSKQLLPRICTWGVFSNKYGNQFYAYNTHLDHKSKTVQSEQLKIIFNHQKIGKHNQSTPTIVMGDMNTKIEGDIEKIITKAGFVDAREKADTVRGPKETRTGWDDSELKQIDHILVKKINSIPEYEVIKSPTGVYPSDHRPIIAKVLI